MMKILKQISLNLLFSIDLGKERYFSIPVTAVKGTYSGTSIEF